MKALEVKNLLLEKREALVHRIAEIEADIRRLVQDSADQAIQKENDGVLDALAIELHRELQEIEPALLRIEIDCSHCGAPISEERHVALPYTTVCVNCAH